MSTKTVAFAGNAFITTASAGASEVINNNGLANWNSASTITSAYFCMASTGSVTIGLNAYLAGSNNSTIKVTVNGTAFTVQLAGTTPKTYPVGTINVAALGYVKVDLQGVTKDGAYFGYVSSLSMTMASAINFANDPANYYWSCCGPSVHMTYTVPANSEYFYNKVTVPVGQDAEKYGIQVIFA
ncbi:hypothetical protein CVT25_012431 [Psilocybe cyanescens]|uniref:DUF5077 domain-containing protein n=1 Tax=Psilocybe cyanescens TaxID=93625 RepID=A0A409XUM5_PSICY|nr:hypothetical protein CVT25_012431 [Psilocybe cyanescens]